MDSSEQCGHLGAELDRLVDRFRAEYDMTYMEVIGVLEMKKQLLVLEAIEKAKKAG